MAYQGEILERSVMNGQKDMEGVPLDTVPSEPVSSGQEAKSTSPDNKAPSPDNKAVPVDDDDKIPLPDGEQEYSGSLEDADDKVEFETDNPPQGGEGYDDSWESDMLSADDSDFF